MTALTLRWDKYESKQLYWYEEDMEFEWEKSRAKSTREETTFNTEVSGAEALLDARDPMQVELKQLSAG